MSLRNKLLFIFLILSLFPVTVLGILSLRISERIIKEAEIARQLQVLESIKKEVREEVYRFQLIGIKYLLDGNVQQYLRLADQGRMDGLRKNEFELSKLLHDYKNTDGTDSTYLLMARGKTLTNRPDRPLDLASYEHNGWFRAGEWAGTPYFWGEPETDGEPCIPCVRSLSFAADPAFPAYLVINVRASVFQRIFSGWPAGYDIGNCIVNQAGTILSHADPALIGTSLAGAYGVKDGVFAGSAGSFESVAGGVPRIFVYSRDERIGWTHLRIIPVRQITARAQNIRNTTLLISALCLLTAALIAFALSRNIILPVKRLIANIRRDEMEIAGIEMPPASSNEILALGESFEILMRQLKQAVERSITMSDEKRVAEIRMLEYQINPHFLYNTLSTIMWLAHSQKTAEVIRVTGALADFLRLSLNRGNDFYSVADEIRHIRSFLAIEETRFPEEFSVSYELAPDVLSCRSIKLVLQPVVENAIQHGLSKKLGGGGRIVIRAERREDQLRYTVLDNGDSMDAAKAREITRMLSEKGGIAAIGIGLRNVHDRIRLFYGEDYGVTLARTDGWTSVHVSIPFQGANG
jgi:two-component system, sensor histidine kinase YesM